MSKKLSPEQRKRLIAKNAGVCCVCKQRGLGVNLHHIDGDKSHTVDENLAVLCVRDHDANHRPHAYTSLRHLELGPEKITEHKKSWEAYVAEAAKPNPTVFAVVSIYGNELEIHSMKLVFQWQNEKVEFERVYHLHDGPPESWIDRAIEEVKWLGNIKLVAISGLLEVEYCPSCSYSMSSTIDEDWAKKITAESWETDSMCTIYINPSQPSLAISIFLKDEILNQGHLHRCGDYLHFACDKYEERAPIQRGSNVRTQAKRIVQKFITDWKPAKLLIGTGDPDKPRLISNLELPEFWERPFNNWGARNTR
jgi:hypothetical protein